jgi:hypothetical protein
MASNLKEAFGSIHHLQIKRNMEDIGLPEEVNQLIEDCYNKLTTPIFAEKDRSCTSKPIKGRSKDVLCLLYNLIWALILSLRQLILYIKRMDTRCKLTLRAYPPPSKHMPMISYYSVKPEVEWIQYFRQLSFFGNRETSN